MIDRDGNHHCSWCGSKIRRRQNRTAPDCCSETCAKLYAQDIGKPDDWPVYLETMPACTACGKVKESPRYRWCYACQGVWRALNAP